MVELSVVVPVLNAMPWLCEQVSALRAQVAQFDWEAILVDNGSTDGSLEYAALVAEVDERFRCVNATGQRGAARARNVGFTNARSELVAFCDADDIAAPGWLASMRRALRDFDLVGGRLEPHDSPGMVSMVRSTFQMERLPERFMPYSGSGNLGVRRAIFESVGGFDERLRVGEDCDFCYRAQLRGASIGFAPEAVVIYRQPASVLAAFRKARMSGMALAELYQIYGHLGYPAPDVGMFARVVRDSRHGFATASGRADLCWRLGVSMGQIEGAVLQYGRKLAGREGAWRIEVRDG